MQALPSELDFSHDQLRAIGCVAIESARLDMLLKRIIVTIFKYDGGVGEGPIDRIETSAKLELLCDLVRVKIGREEAIKQFRRIHAAIADALRIRDIVIYGRARIRSPHLSARDPVSSGFGGRGSGRARRPRTEGAMSVARRLNKLHGELWGFCRRYGADFLPAPPGLR